MSDAVAVEEASRASGRATVKTLTLVWVFLQAVAGLRVGMFWWAVAVADPDQNTMKWAAKLPGSVVVFVVISVAMPLFIAWKANRQGLDRVARAYGMTAVAALVAGVCLALAVLP